MGVAGATGASDVVLCGAPRSDTGRVGLLINSGFGDTSGTAIGTTRTGTGLLLTGVTTGLLGTAITGFGVLITLGIVTSTVFGITGITTVTGTGTGLVILIGSGVGTVTFGIGIASRSSCPVPVDDGAACAGAHNTGAH